jgi:hypothetical protein
MKVASNEATIHGGATSSSYWGTSFNANQEVYATVTSTNLSGSSEFYLFVRLQSPGTNNPDGYFIKYEAGGPVLNIWRMDDGVGTKILADVTINLNSGSDRFGLSVSGTTLEGWYKQGAGAWTSIGTQPDATYNSSGYIGMSVGSGNGALDDFGGGNI